MYKRGEIVTFIKDYDSKIFMNNTYKKVFSLVPEIFLPIGTKIEIFAYRDDDTNPHPVMSNINIAFKYDNTYHYGCTDDMVMNNKELREKKLKRILNEK